MHLSWVLLFQKYRKKKKEIQYIYPVCTHLLNNWSEFTLEKLCSSKQFKAILSLAMFLLPENMFSVRDRKVVVGPQSGHIS